MEGGQQLNMFEDPLAAEAWEADKTKNNPGINVIIGNPPYSGESANKGEWIMSLMEDYKKEPGGKEKLKERNPKLINDDYVKFLRFAQKTIQNNNGICTYICPHGFLDNLTFRGVRWSLFDSYNKIYIVNLHGNANKSEKTTDGQKDENVFDIKQGVCICIFVKTGIAEKNTEIYYKDIWGERQSKYYWLNNNSLRNVDFTKLQTVEET